MNPLRVRAEQARQILKNWLKTWPGTAKAFAGRLRFHAAKVPAAFRTWIGQGGRLRLGLAALAVLFVAGIVVAAVFSETLGRHYRAISDSGRGVPLPAELREAVAERAKQLAAALDARIDRKGKFAGEAWISAQVLVALKENDDSVRIGVKSIEQYFRSVEGPECACWRRLPRGEFPNHIGVTSWVLWTLARYGIPAQKGELEFLLSTQDREGGWPLFAGTQQKFASSYGTAVAMLALHEQSTLKANRAQRVRLAAAAKRGADWLKSRVEPGRARWADYPGWADAGQRGELLGLSGFVLFALHRVGAPELAALDRDWLNRLPPEAPGARESGASRRVVQIGRRTYRDDTRYTALPWTILATAAAYPGASISEKVRAMEWLERALAPGASIHALSGKERNPAIAAEALLALRNEALRE